MKGRLSTEPTPSTEQEKHYFADGYLEEFNQSPEKHALCARDFFQIYSW
jgi:hypothetical protein